MNVALERPRLSLLTALLVVSIYALDVATGNEISLSILYLIPIALGTWYGSRQFGLLLSLTCAVAWLLGDWITGASYSNPVIPFWNMLVRLGFFVIVTQALSARRRVETELVAARANALAASSAKTDFLNRVTHELRTPLTAIIGFADLLQKRAGAYLTNDDRECLRRIRVNADSLLSMVDGVLDVGSVEARRRPAAREPVDVAALVEAVATDMRRALPESVTLCVEVPAGLDPLVTDPALLRQVLLNLVSNAVKFTEAGTIRILLVSEGTVPRRVAVQDTGIGIEATQLGSIFEPFEQADGSIHRRFGGAGLGLTIARDLSQVMGHRVEVESSAGVGSTFSVIFASE